MGLTDKQLGRLKDRLLYTTNNVYLACEELFKQEVGEEVFTQLEAKVKIFKCEECSCWLPLSTRAAEDLCKECSR